MNKFLYLVTAAISDERGGAARHNLDRRQPKNHPSKIWFNLAE